MTIARPRWVALWLAVVLMLLFWGTRIAQIGAFPIFLDEAVHIDYAETLPGLSPLAYASEGRQLTLWLLVLAQPGAAAPVEVARLALLLPAALGFAAFITCGRLLAGHLGMLLAGAVYILSPYLFFFDRLALADMPSAALVIVALAFGLRLLWRASLWDAAWMGVALFGAVLFKVAVLPFFGVPLALALALPNPRLAWRARVRWAAVGTGVAVVLTALFGAVLAWRGYDLLNLFGVHNTGGGSLVGRWLTNLGYARLWLLDYYPVVGVLVAAAVIFLLWQRRFALPLVALAPFAVLLLNQRQTPRYWLAPVMVLLLGGVVVLAILIRRWPRLVGSLTVIGAVAWALVIWLPFVQAAYTDPANVPLPMRDRAEYLQSDAAGTGLEQVARLLQAEAPVQVWGLLSNCRGLRYTAPDLPLECPRIAPTGESIDELAQLMAESAAPGVYVVLEASPYVPSALNGRVVALVTRPGDLASLTLYELTP